jgi:hypothetical protein
MIKKTRGGFFEEDSVDLQKGVGELDTQRKGSDDAAKASELQSDDTYNMLNDANYPGQFSTLKGGFKAGCSTCKKQNGGCLTCPKGQGKIIAIVRTFSIIIPKYYKKYKDTSEKDTERAVSITGQANSFKPVKPSKLVKPSKPSKPVKPAKAPKPVKPSKPSKPVKAAKAPKTARRIAKKIKGGLFNASDWDGKYEWKPNQNVDGKLYSNDIHDLSGLNLNHQKMPNVSTIDTTYNSLTSVIV